MAINANLSAAPVCAGRPAAFVLLWSFYGSPEGRPHEIHLKIGHFAVPIDGFSKSKRQPWPFARLAIVAKLWHKTNKNVAAMNWRHNLCQQFVLTPFLLIAPKGAHEIREELSVATGS